LEPNLYSSGLSSHNPLGGEGPLVSNSLPPLSASELSASPELVKYPTSSNRDSASAMTSSWSGKESSFPNRGSQPAMRPPPGFGPLPGKSTGRPSAVNSQGIIQPPTAHLPSQSHTEGDDQVDDYGWLDDFRTPKPVTSQSGYPGERDFFSYSNNHNMWSTGDGNIRSSGFESSPFPFPGKYLD
jgi:protein SMG7